MCRQRHRGRRSQGRRSIAPDLVEQGVDASQPVVERSHEPPLAIEAVRDVFVELGRGVEHRLAVARSQHLGSERPERARGR